MVSARWWSAPSACPPGSSITCASAVRRPSSPNCRTAIDLIVRGICSACRVGDCLRMISTETKRAGPFRVPANQQGSSSRWACRSASRPALYERYAAGGQLLRHRHRYSAAPAASPRRLAISPTCWCERRKMREKIQAMSMEAKARRHHRLAALRVGALSIRTAPVRIKTLRYDVRKPDPRRRWSLAMLLGILARAR